MTSLERFVARLVEILEQRDVAALHRPIRVRDLRDSVIPYRFNRSVLDLSSSEDYELLLLRLVAEEGGFVKVAPPETAERIREELAGPNPDLGLIDALHDTTVQLGVAGIARARALREEQAGPPPAEPPTTYLPPEETAAEAASVPAPAELTPSPPDREEPDPVEEPPTRRPPEPEFEPLADSISVDDEEPDAGGSATPSQCASCHAALPSHRPVAFCPFCGGPAGVRRCVRCGSEIEPGWKHCVACGHLADRASFA